MNGSGKSSTVKLLTRLHDPTEGEILLDGHPLPSYKLDDIRRSTAILCQYHPVFPMSLGDNVALGLAERSVTNDQIQEAVRLGGAADFISKRKHGLETSLGPVSVFSNGSYLHTIGEEANKELKAMMDEHNKTTSLSGGETQRLSA